MKLKEYLQSKPRGTAAKLAEMVGISATWLSLITNEHNKPSPELCVLIEKATKGKVKRADLRPDMFGRKVA